jgi:hypothetical protein
MREAHYFATVVKLCTHVKDILVLESEHVPAPLQTSIEQILSADTSTYNSGLFYRGISAHRNYRGISAHRNCTHISQWTPKPELNVVSALELVGFDISLMFPQTCYDPNTLGHEICW